MRLSRLRRSAAADEGFTLVELLASMFVIAIVLVAMLGVYVSSMKTVGVAKQRQEASQLANQTMEELRALPYDVVVAGLNSADSTIASDPNIASGRFKPAFSSAINELLLVNSSTQQPPLYPHLAQIASAINNVTYTVATYVSSAATAPAQYWLTVVVSWNSAATKHQTKQVATRSRLFQPSGCGATSHPYPGPCQAFLYGDAQLSTPAFSVLPAAGETEIATGLGATAAQLTLPQVEATTQVEQISAISGKLVGSQAAITAGTTTSTGGTLVKSNADTDPSTTGSGTPSATLAQSAAAVTQTGDGNTLTVTPWTSESGSTASTVSATSAANCQRLDGTVLTTGQACASARLTPAGSAAATVTLTPASRGNRSIGTLTLASVATGGSLASFSARYTSPGTTYCTSATGVGCTAAGVTRTLGTVAVGGLAPASVTGDVVPAGFSNVFSISGYSDKTVSQQGFGAGTSASSVAGGTLTYWNGSGYSSVCLGGTGCTAPTTAPTIPEVVASYAAGSSFITVTIDTVLSLNGATSRSDGVSPCQDVACTGTLSAGPPTASVTYTISYGGSNVAHYTVNMDLGSVLAKATYKAAPLA